MSKHASQLIRAPIRRVGVGGEATTNSVVLSPAAEFNNLITVMHRRSTGAPGAGPGASLIVSSGNFSAFWEMATDGQTTVPGATGPSLDRMGAAAYAFAKHGITNYQVNSGTSITPSFGTLTLNNPGSWVCGAIGVGTAGVHLVSITKGIMITTPDDRVTMIDSNGPAGSWSGITGTLESNQPWTTIVWEIEPL